MHSENNQYLPGLLNQCSCQYRTEVIHTGKQGGKQIYPQTPIGPIARINKEIRSGSLRNGTKILLNAPGMIFAAAFSTLEKKINKIKSLEEQSFHNKHPVTGIPKGYTCTIRKQPCQTAGFTSNAQSPEKLPCLF